MLSRKIMWMMLGLLMLLAVVYLGSCAKDTIGPVPVNKLPKVTVVNIPPNNSHFTNNPTINWYGTDADGYVVGYEYAVIQLKSLPASLDTSNAAAVKLYALENIKTPAAGVICDPACWTYIDAKKTDKPSSQTIRLFADKDPADTVSQLFFVRAVDNDSARSDIEFRIYSRNNHPPDTEIKSTGIDTLGYYDLPETTTTYKGISFEWKGTDKIDYPSDNPEPQFDYFYQLFGPFNRSEIPFRDSGLVDRARVDTLLYLAQNKLVLTSHDTSATGGVWVKQITAKFYNLWRNQPVSNTTRTGYFMLKVTSRDDAFVPDPTPDYIVFKAIDPKFENTVLVYLSNFCTLTTKPGGIVCDSMPTLQAFYKKVFADAGYPFTDFLILRGGQTAPPKELLGSYKVYVMLTDGEFTGLSTDHYSALTQYLDLGGNVWAWGLNPLQQFSKLPGLVGFGVNTIPYRYFNVSGEFHAGWTASFVARVSDTLPPPYKITNEEFVGGLALPDKGFSDFRVDLNKVKYYTTTDTAAWVCNLKDSKTGKCLDSSYVVLPRNVIHFVGAPNANYFIRDVYSEPIFLFNSYYGDFVPDSLKNTIVGLQGKVTALRYNSGVFKTAVFGFSLWTLKPEDATAIIRTQMQWFLQ